MMAEVVLASPEECRPLFDLMAKVHAIAPWSWMDETQLFGVQDPETSEVGFVSVMGMAGEHYAIGVYQGARGLYGFLHLQDIGPFLEPEDLLNTPQLQASFEDREMLEKHDRDLIKALGLKYRGKNAWPQFRSYRPGYAPWFVEPPEARFLAHALGQVLEVAPRVQQNPDMLELDGDSDYLVRVADKTDTGLRWRDEIMANEPPLPISLEMAVEPGLLEAVSQLPRVSNRVEADFFMLPTMVDNRTERPYFPYALLLVETTSGAVIGMELLSPSPSLEEMWAQVGVVTLRQLRKVGILPAEIRVRDELLYGMLMPFSQSLGFKVKQVRRLPKLDPARASLEGYLGM
ncbi:MAG: hypothetical protein L6Q98_24305 [Anaerolineae bacterium]|nr:hypothetical protein [Anaerolineae bacterium]NUQ06862.1 hypothetical protein [Anaerolineae bacterium]